MILHTISLVSLIVSNQGSSSAPIRHSHIINVVRSVDTQATTSKRIPENTGICSVIAVRVSLDDSVTSGQD